MLPNGRSVYVRILPGSLTKGEQAGCELLGLASDHYGEKHSTDVIHLQGTAVVPLRIVTVISLDAEPIIEYTGRTLQFDANVFIELSDDPLAESVVDGDQTHIIMF